MTSKIKNYTSSVPADRSIMKIERMLVDAGATNISRAYENQEVSGFMFQLGNMIFKLPSKVKAVEETLLSEMKRPRRETIARITDQARRTAWRILDEWVAIQISMVRLKQAEAQEVFLPYAYDFKRNMTLFDMLKHGDLNKLLEFKEEKKP
jgi:hypothetical protein